MNGTAAAAVAPTTPNEIRANTANQTQTNFLLYWFLIYFVYLSDHLIIGDYMREPVRRTHTHTLLQQQHIHSSPKANEKLPR